MAVQEITIDYTVAATKRLPSVDVHLVVQYDDDPTKQTKEDQKLGAFKATSVSGTYTTTKDGTSTTYDVTGFRPRGHLGGNNDLIYPTGAHIVDRHGLTFLYNSPYKNGKEHLKPVNLFNDRKGGNDHYAQYTDYLTRKATVTVTQGETTESTSSALVEEAPALCFAQGTLIRTSRGDVAVEALKIGDRAVTASGALRPVTWLGRREMDLRHHSRASEIAPVRIAAHAFGPGLPARELFLSPGHPVLVGADADHEGGHLVPIMCLVNGTTIRRVAAETVVYWHVELDGHDILMAEGLPAESYIDCGDRAFFTRGEDGVLADPDLVLPGFDGRCRPVAVDGAVVEAERDRIDCVFAARLSHACAWPEAARDF